MVSLKFPKSFHLKKNYYYHNICQVTPRNNKNYELFPTLIRSMFLIISLRRYFELNPEDQTRRTWLWSCSLSQQVCFQNFALNLHDHPHLTREAWLKFIRKTNRAASRIPSSSRRMVLPISRGEERRVVATRLSGFSNALHLAAARRKCACIICFAR